jgi:hypothetical protein
VEIRFSPFGGEGAHKKTLTAFGALLGLVTMGIPRMAGDSPRDAGVPPRDAGDSPRDAGEPPRGAGNSPKNMLPANFLPQKIQ